MQPPLEDLFERYRSQGDVAALGEVFDRGAPELLRLALHLAPEAAQAEDLVQGTFLKALEHAERFERGRALVPWLAGILVHEAARARRQRARVVDPERLVERASEDPARSLAEAELEAEVARAVRALPAPYADVLSAHLLEGARAVDIAQRLERAPGTVRMQILRGLELLRNALPPSLATAALLASPLRGHAALRERVLARAAELAAPPRAPERAPEPAPETGPRTPARPVPWLPGGPMLPLVTAFAGLAGLAVLVSVPSAPRSGPTAAPPAPVQAPTVAAPLQEPRARASTPPAPAPVAAAPSSGPSSGPSALETPLLTGRVLDVQGLPVAGVAVTLSSGELRTFSLLDLELNRASAVLATTTSDADGRFAFPLRRGQPVELAAELGPLGALSVGHHAGQSVELVLRPPRLLAGRVLRASDGAPVAGAEVKAVLGQERPRLERRTTSASDGSYALELPWRENVRLSARHADGFGWIVPAIAFGPDGSAHVDVALEAGVELTGRVTDATSGAPIAGATVGEAWTFQRTATTDAEGRYRLRGVVHGPYFARAPGYGEGWPTGPMAAAAGGARLDFALAPGRSVNGRVLDEYGAPVSDAYVAAVAYEGHADWRATRTDGGGLYRLTDLNALPHALLVGKDGFATQVHDLPADVADGDELPALTLRAPQVVAGRALDASGHPVAGAAVTLAGWNHDRFAWTGGDGSRPSGYVYVSERETTSDAEGRFWFGDVPAGRFELTAVRGGGTESDGVLFTLEEGGERDDLVLTFPEGARVFGRVVDEAGTPLAGVSVCVDREGLTDGGLPCARSAADGRFEIRGLPPGTFTLEALAPFLENESPSPWITTVLAEIEGGPQEVVLARGATIEGTLLGADGRVAIGSYVQPRVASLEEAQRILGGGSTTDAAGRFRLVVPRDTLWTVDVWSGTGLEGSAPVLSVDGVAAGTHGLVWRLAP